MLSGPAHDVAAPDGFVKTIPTGSGVESVTTSPLAAVEPVRPVQSATQKSRQKSGGIVRRAGRRVMIADIHIWRTAQLLMHQRDTRSSMPPNAPTNTARGG